MAKVVSLRTLDSLWVEHLEVMDQVRDSVRLRAYGQQDPLVEYKNEGHKRFQILLSTMESLIINTLFKASMAQKEPPQKQVSAPKNNQEIGRNDPCPCGSGKKYKKCCGK